MTIRSFAPCRIDLSAGFPDVQPFCDEAEGTVVNAAITAGVSAWLSTDDVQTSPIVARFTREIANHLDVTNPYVVQTLAEAPPGSGLGTSGATTVAIAALLTSTSAMEFRYELIARTAWTCERLAGIAGGTQDQLASAQGGVGVVESIGEASNRRLIPVSTPWLSERLIIAKPIGERISGDIIEHATAPENISRGRMIVKSMSTVGKAMAHALGAEDTDGLADAVNDSRRLLHQLSERIVDPSFERCLMSLGVRAAKPCGAGGRGAAWVCIVNPDDRQQTVQSLKLLGIAVPDVQVSVNGVRVDWSASGQSVHRP